MKGKLFKITVLFLTLGFLVASVSAIDPATDESVDQSSFCSAINEALHADGFGAEESAAKLLSLFQDNPTEFLNVFENYTEEETDCVLGLLAGYAALDSSDEFLQILYSLDSTKAIHRKLIAHYEEAISVIESVSDAENDEVPQYDVDTIENLVSAYLKNGDTENMELFALLADSYQKEPVLIGDIMNQFSDNEIQLLAAGVANIYKSEGVNSMNNISENNGSFQKALNQAMSSEENKLTDDMLASATVYTPEITSFSYSGTIEVGEATTLTIKLTERNGTAAARSYTVKTYCTRGGTEYQVSSVMMTIPKDSTTAIKTINLTFSHAGTFTTRVAVYNGATLLTTREGRSPDVSHGRWKITCTFPEDRTKYGTFALYNASGELQETGDCLGLSVKNIDENLSFGNTPCGTYTGYLTGPITGYDENGESNRAKYGPNKCVATNAVDVPCINNGDRDDGMWIHGGRSQTKLQPTEGCVRVFDNDMLAIENSVESMTTSENGHYKTGDVIYKEW